MKITSLKQQIKNPGRVSVFVDEKYEFSLSLDELVKYKVKNGEELSAQDLKKFKKISADGKLRARAMEWLLNRPHSTREFKDYMRLKKAEPEFTEQLQKEFTKRGYLDDGKFAEWFIELKMRKGASNRMLRAELFKKGIDRELVDNLLEAHGDDEVERLKLIISKKQSQSRYKNDQAKLIKYLTSQGFSWSLVKDQLKVNSPED